MVQLSVEAIFNIFVLILGELVQSNIVVWYSFDHFPPPHQKKFFKHISGILFNCGTHVRHSALTVPLYSVSDSRQAKGVDLKRKVCERNHYA